ncbi:MAG: hypothetical protein GY751_20730 [Bacteroidetes bacterium]|jgi:hypothetical protein|nr:hypothetical protein [Bacteroidota bacterium]|tara:strand:+ start:4390 stop:4836 length:447 start_codon:yes stop_codon:yes gene_type:complete
MVKIEVKCEKGYDAKVFEKGDTLRYYLKGPSNMSNPRGEIGMIDLRGRFAGKFKAADNLPSGVGYGFVAEDKAKITLTTPDGKALFIGQKAGPMTTQDRITLGMCINNATSLVCVSDASTSAENEDTVKQVYDLADALLAEYNKRYNE